jgi:GNAT superfamily N-acetyltransferase
MVALLGQMHETPTAVPDIEMWRRMLGQPGRTVLLAEIDTDPVGTADLSIAPGLVHGATPRASVDYVVVAAAHRREGVGRALMQECERRAREAACYEILLMSGDHREGAHRFYGSLGYERCATGFKLDLEGS